jgi:AcrR family transcriptional regulator
MSKPKKRTYHSENRNAQAAQTRSRILVSARQLFQSEGFEGVTIEKLAQAAEVSSPTIYSLFQSKRGVLFALMEEALPAEQIDALVEEAKQEKSPKKRITYGAKIARKVYDAERAEMDIFRSASVLAPEFKEVEKEKELRRYLRQEETVKTLMEGKSILKELSLSQARDILWALTGRDMYRMLVVERGWTSDEYEEWLGQLLIKSLIADA